MFEETNWVVRPRGPGRYRVVLRDDLRGVLNHALDEVAELLDQPDLPVLRRLQPPAYLDDPDKDNEYQLLAGEELRTSRREAIAVVKEMVGRTEVTEDDLWAWLRSINALRLVLGTILGIEDDDDSDIELDDDDPAAPVWAIYGLATQVQYNVIRALES